MRVATNLAFRSLNLYNKRSQQSVAHPDTPSPAIEPEVKQPTTPKLLQVLGPGLITGASDDDPSGIATYSQVGAQFGFDMGWVMLFSWPLMCAIQEISARIGRVTGKGIAGNLRLTIHAAFFSALSLCWSSPIPST
jgi:Mn2+/Fe2+ NRAMP family transporter